MNFEYLNDMIAFIEEHLTENISYSDLAKIVGVSEYSLQRIFIFLTNISLAEYIRKRRLSKAFEELKTSNIKIIDLAIKYNYDSATSFTRSFKNTFGRTPTECKKNSAEYKQFPIIKFNSNGNNYQELCYQIKDVEQIKLYCVKTSAHIHDDLLYKIRKLYLEIKDNGLYKKFNENGMYGIYKLDKSKHTYYIGTTKKYGETEELIIPEGKYVVFSANSREQNDILKTEEIIYTQWKNSTNYDIEDEFNFELYSDDICYLYVMIKDKQN